MFKLSGIWRFSHSVINTIVDTSDFEAGSGSWRHLRPLRLGVRRLRIAADLPTLYRDSTHTDLKKSKTRLFFFR